MNKEISLKTFLIILIGLSILECVIMFIVALNNKQKEAIKDNEEHCKFAVCNDDYTICYNYALDEEENTSITWRGSCAEFRSKKK